MRNVQVDPATTAFAAMALLRAGHTPVSGDHKASVRRATEYLVHVVETYDTAGPKITDITGTQPQAKLGPLVDTSMTAQFLARVLPTLPEGEPLRSRVNAALERCLAKLQESQQKDGSWNVEGGWAPVLQSSLGCSAPGAGRGRRQEDRRRTARPGPRLSEGQLRPQDGTRRGQQGRGRGTCMPSPAPSGPMRAKPAPRRT